MADYYRNPKARHDGLSIERVAHELVVHDSVHGTFHTLNQTAASIWLACDGQTDRGAIASATALPEQTVDAAIAQFGDAGLLMNGATTEAKFDRRWALRLAAAGLAVPVVASISSPDASAAISEGAGGPGGCLIDSDCPGFRDAPTCQPIVCNAGTCESVFAPAGTPCGGISQTCNGAGFCLV